MPSVFGLRGDGCWRLLNGKRKEMSKDERGGNVRRQGGKEQRRYGEEGERGERENAEAAVCTHVEVGCVCVCVCVMKCWPASGCS